MMNLENMQLSNLFRRGVGISLVLMVFHGFARADDAEPAGVELGSSADWQLQTNDGAVATEQAVEDKDVPGAMQVTVKTAGNKGSSVQLYHRGLSFSAATNYQLRFFAKASEDCAVAANGMLGVAPYTSFGEPEVQLTREWKSYSIDFTSDVTTTDGRVTFTRMGSAARTYWLGKIRLVRKGAANTNPDALRLKVKSELAVFTQWLKANNAKGYIGETGWPANAKGDSEKWNALANAWFQDANDANLWVTYWSTGVRWGNTYFAQCYTQSSGAPGVDTPNLQASVLESNIDTTRYERGVNVSGGEFGDSSGKNPGTYDVDYSFDPPATFQYLASRKLTLVRIPFRWERIQPKLMGNLDPDMVSHLRQVVASANKAGLKVILDMHNYAKFSPRPGEDYHLGTDKLPYAAFTDVWQKISTVFKDQPDVYYGLMNEPVDIPAEDNLRPAQVWEKASQEVVDAIRANGDDKTILVGGYFWSSTTHWAENHPKAWIKDPADNIRYEAHHYFDSDSSGTYRNSYQQDLVDAQKRGFGSAQTVSTTP